MSNHTPAAQHGRGLPRRIRKSFDTKSETQRYERWIIATQNNKGWVEKPSDRRPLTELIELWWVHHGRTLKDGEAIKKKLLNISDRMDNPRSDKITRASLAQYRADRLATGVKPGTINKDQKILSGVFTALIRVGLFHNEHPVAGQSLMRDRVPEMAFLTRPQ